ncbi:MAG: DUF1365 family protein [Rhizobiales bacterium]|nr:DUF1365 family protein [Hyphomicrobiales bacterium]
MPFRSALYNGRVWHRRLVPRRHRLAYRMFWMQLDLDEIDALDGRLRFFSRNRFNLFSFFDRDHGDGSDEPLRAQIDRHLAAAGLDADVAAVRVMAMPRLLGYAFNQLTLFLCYRADGGLAAVLYEVNNTFGERHAYLIPAGEPEGGRIRQRAEKAFYVSPFLDMDMTYDFALQPPGERVGLAIQGRRQGVAVIAAAFEGERVELTDGALLRAFLAFPALTLKVVAGIHYEALRIWLKGIGLRRRPAAPTHFVSIGRALPAPREDPT